MAKVKSIGKKGATYRLQGGKTQHVSAGSDMGMMHRFMRRSRQLTNTQLNKTPGVKTDRVGEVSRPPKKGFAHGDQRSDYVNIEPKTIRKVKAPQTQATKLTASKNKPGNNKRNKGMVKKYK